MKLLSIIIVAIFSISVLAIAQNESDNSKNDSLDAISNNNKDAYSVKDSLYKIEMQNGFTYIGNILSYNDEEVIIVNKYIGELRLEKKLIKSITEIPQEYSNQSEYWFPNPNSTRNLLSPTGYGLKSGEAYYQNIYVFFNLLFFGITDYFSLGVGTEFITLSSGNPMIFLNPKLSFEISENVNVGLSSLLIYGHLGRGNIYSGVHSAVITYGNKDDNITLGGGVFTLQQEDPSGVITLSGMLRISKSLALVSENWYVPDSNVDFEYSSILSYAIRLMGENFSFDLGFINNPSLAEHMILGIPYIDFIYKW